MSTHLYYTLVDFLCIIFPFLLSFQKVMPFYKNWKALLPATLGMMFVFIPWDAYFTANGIWGFNDQYIIGFKILHLPIEEWLFFICIPYACVFSYECVKYFLPEQPLKTASLFISAFYMIIAIALMIVFYDHWYTFAACLASLILLALHTFYWKSNFLGYFHLTWIILLVPFFISNGVLTGLTFYNYSVINLSPEKIQNMIVWYNNNHNLGIRIWSVPLDDFFYGMAMFLLTVTIYERRLKRPL